MKVVRAMLKLAMGMKAKPSMRDCEPKPAVANLAKELICVCTMTLASAVTEFCTPEGRP